MKLQRSKSRWHGGFEEADCPIAVLEPRVEPLVHLRDGFAITYWKYYEPLPAADTTLAEYAQTLERLHAGMRQLDAPAPHFTERVEEAQSIVRDRSQSPELIDADRELLASSLQQPSRGPSATAARQSSCCTANRTPGNVLRHENRPAVHRPRVGVAAGRSNSTSPMCPKRLSKRYPDSPIHCAAPRLPDPHARDGRGVARGSGRRASRAGAQALCMRCSA